ncbi:neuroendocrine convertase 1-like [Rhopilema esculentum]|uniref:neuroendocrine convertase 1-like n=1 Tax=Rhopilema esculentum TaxID=499914 RepID=UPI0031D41C3F
MVERWAGFAHSSFVKLLLLVTLLANQSYAEKATNDRYFTNGWAIKVPEPGGLQKAKEIAKRHGFEKVSKVGTVDGFYHLEHPKHPRRSRRSAEDRTGRLEKENNILWVEQQYEIVRKKRGYHHQRVVARGINPRFADPLWDEQWYLDDKRNALDLDINVIPIWNQGITGKGVVVTILDDGIEHNHTDIVKNYDPAASWDVNDNDPDPFPRYDPTNENKHGTRCAGEVAAEANNSKCGVGVAFNARIGGVRMLDGRVTDRVEAESLSLNPQYIDIYSASWGPSDDGMTVEGPGTLASAAFANGIAKGRGGLGSIYVWASGNGGRHDDSCNCDGYTASIYTLSISSSSDHGESPWYSEACASTLATTLSSGAHGEKRIVTTDLHNLCTERHTGTSASAPLAAGIIALALQRNPKLTWRDVQHIVVTSADWQPLKHDTDWRMNGVGFHVNEKFGFGLLNAERIVTAADPKTWKNVPESRECRGKSFSDAKALRWNQPLTVEIETDGCLGTKNEIRYLEHVQLVLTLDYSRRGDLTIILTTPMGTKSILLPTRSEDSSDEGFKKWPFMTTHAWGEDPRGKWTLEIHDAGDARANTGTLRDWQLVLYGTKQKPNYLKVSHPDIPIHRKAVNDDTKSIQGHQQPSVTITKVTYTFGSRPLSQSQSHPNQAAPGQSLPQGLPDLPTIVPLNNIIPKKAIQSIGQPTHIIDNLLASSVNSLPRFQNPAFQQAAPNYGSLGVTRPQNFQGAGFSESPFPLMQTRSSIPYNNYMKRFNQRNYQSQSITNYYLRQGQHQNQRSPIAYPYKWRQASAGMKVMSDPRAPFWDYFGRTFNKRSLKNSEKIKDKEYPQSVNSLMRTVKKGNLKYT